MKPFTNKYLTIFYILIFTIEILLILVFKYWRIPESLSLVGSIMVKAAMITFMFHVLLSVIIFFSLIGKIIVTKPAVWWSVVFLILSVAEFGYLIHKFLQIEG